MKKTLFKKKSILSILLTLIVITCGTISVNAQTSEVITYEEYSQTLIKEYQKYGLDVEMEEIPGSIYTNSVLQAELLAVETNVEQIMASSFQGTLVENNNIISQNPAITPRAMYAYMTVSGTDSQIDLQNILIPRTFTAKVTAELYVDVQRDYILSAGKPTLKLMSATGYDDYIVYISHTATIDNSSTNLSKHNVTYNVVAELKESFSVSGVQSWAKVEKLLVVKIYPFK